jgi:hypothetical protein
MLLQRALQLRMGKANGCRTWSWSRAPNRFFLSDCAGIARNSDNVSVGLCLPVRDEACFVRSRQMRVVTRGIAPSLNQFRFRGGAFCFAINRKRKE